MTKYTNHSGNSGVVAYELGQDFILVEFVNGGRYRYTSRSAGRRNIEEMKRLAMAGQGLNTYINQNVRELFDRKVR